MKVVNWSKIRETGAVEALQKRFARTLYVATSFVSDKENVWVFPDMNKGSVEWTKRLLRKFLETDETHLIKIDPDTNIIRMPKLPKDCDVAGDFRKAPVGWIWLGAYQYFTRVAAQKILDDPKYVGNCVFQDQALCESVIRCGLIAHNMQEVNGWCTSKTAADVTHYGKSEIPREPLGVVNFSVVGK